MEMLIRHRRLFVLMFMFFVACLSLARVLCGQGEKHLTYPTRFPQWVEQTVRKLSLEEKIGQIFADSFAIPITVVWSHLTIQILAS